MVHIDTRVDRYIEKAQEFARPVLNYIRSVVHEACPEAKETIKWGAPHFEYAGSILCHMAAFKHHCAFGFRLGALMQDPDHVLEQVGEKSSMGHFGPVRHIRELPAKKVLKSYVRQAMELNEKGIKRPQPKAAASGTALAVPDDFLRQLRKSKPAWTTFEKFTYSQKKDYVEWITDAKTDATKNKRMATAVEWLEEGKTRNWKYVKRS